MSAVVPRVLGGLALAVRDGFAYFDDATGITELVAAVETDRKTNRMNDGKCDQAGRFFAGTKADDDTPGAGALYCLELNGNVRQVVADVTISNGIGWSPDERLMYYVDSATGRVDVFDYDPISAELANRRPFVHIAPAAGLPDGLTVDARGWVWVALWGGSAVRCYRPDGRLAEVLPLPVRNVTSCTFGGADLDVLFVTTARPSDTSAEKSDPDAGAVFSARLGVAGLPANAYGG